MGILSQLRQIPNWRTRFDKVCAYVMDSFAPVRADSYFAEVLDTVDHFFTPMSGNLAAFRSLGSMSVHMIPFGCDVAQFGANRAHRPLDVIGYGRQLPAHSQTLARAYNTSDSARLFVHTDFLSQIQVADHAAQRAQFWSVLQRSKVALAYDVLAANSGRFEFSFVAQRWFECLAAGCAIVGKRPTCVEARDLLDWQDATIEAPDDPADFLEFLDELLRDTNRLAQVHQANFANALARHDWRYRIADMLQAIGMETPVLLDRQIEQLQARAKSRSSMLLEVRGAVEQSRQPDQILGFEDGAGTRSFGQAR